MSLPHQT